MKLTLFGARTLLFYGMMIAAFFGAPYVNLFFLLLGFLSVQWALTIVWTWRNGSGISASFEDFAPIPVGGTMPIQASIQAEQRTRFAIQLILDLSRDKRAKNQAIGRVQVLRGKASVAIQMPDLKRGVYPLHKATVSSTYPFGLLRRANAVQTNAEIVVYPAPNEIAANGRSAEDMFREMLGTSVAGNGDLQPSSLRDFRIGDSMRAVHWRASARRGKLVIQEWDGGAEQGMEVVLDRRCSEEELEHSLSELSTLVKLAREAKQILAIRSQGLNETYGEGHQDWRIALRFLAAAQTLPEAGNAPPAAAPEVLRLPRRLAHA